MVSELLALTVDAQIYAKNGHPEAQRRIRGFALSYVSEEQLHCVVIKDEGFHGGLRSMRCR